MFFYARLIEICQKGGGRKKWGGGEAAVTVFFFFLRLQIRLFNIVGYVRVHVNMNLTTSIYRQRAAHKIDGCHGGLSARC